MKIKPLFGNARNLKEANIVSFIILLIAVIALVCCTVKLIDNFKGDGYIVNTAGKQRYLSQKITKQALQIIHSEDLDEDLLVRKKIYDDIALFKSNYTVLLENNNSELVQNYLAQLRPTFNSICENATSVAESKDLQALGRLKQAETDFLGLMDDTVLQYQKDNSREIELFMYFIVLDGLILMVVVTFITFYFIRPLIHRTMEIQRLVKEQNKDLIEVNQKLEKSNSTVSLLNSELSTANLTKEKFIMILAHDLRNPLNNLSSLSDILRSSIGSMNNEELVELSKMIERSAKTTLNLLVNILEWMKIQQDKITLNRELCNLLGLVVETKELFNDLAQNKKVHIRIDVPDELSLNVDREMIKTVLRNLISNALKYTPEQGEVAVKSEKDKNYVYLSVSDTGIGMNQKTLDKLFHLGEVVSKSGTQGEKGTGFGLLLSKEFVAKHNGQITVESEEGKGSTFTVKLPLTQVG